VSSDKGDKRKKRPAGTDNPDRPETSTAKFFLAIHYSKLGASRIYRVYVHPDALSFIYIGPPHPWIDLESARRMDQAHWAIQAAQTVRKGATLAIAGGTAVAGILGLALLKAAFRDAPKVLDIILFVLTFVAIVIPLGVFLVTASIWALSKRISYLDGLTEDQLRKEAETSQWSFTATRDNVSDVSVDPAEESKSKASARLSMTHDATGKWKLDLISSKDTKRAIGAFRQLLGDDSVEVNT
jgi:hypothetical protein